MALSDWRAREIVFFAIGLPLVTTGTRYVGDYRDGIFFIAVAGALAFVFFRNRKLALVVSSLSCILSLGLMASQKQEDRQPVEQKADLKAGAETYGKYCASCHGKLGKGDGPVAEVLKIAPSDLTALAKTYEGKFPRGYVSAVLIFGKRVTSHGSDDMPVWGARKLAFIRFGQSRQVRRSNL